MIRLSFLRSIVLASAVIVLTACVSSRPVETQGAVDDRPLLFFSVEGRVDPSTSLSVYVDNLYMGSAIELSKSNAGLAILPGTHVVEVRQDKRIVSSQKVYLGSGGSKTITVKNQ